MAGRPEKRTVDFFSHDTHAGAGRTVTILFNHFGHEGISGWWQLLEVIGSTDNHVVNIVAIEDFEYLAARMHFPPDRLRAILNALAELDAIDKDLYEGGIIWSQNFVDRLTPIYKYRKQNPPIKPELFDIIGVGVTVKRLKSQLTTAPNELSRKENQLPNPEIPHRERESKESKEIPPIVPLKGEQFVLPDWIKKETWDAFKEMRLRARAPLTERAKALVCSRLSSLRAAGDDPNEVLNQSVMNSWKGVFPLKGGNGHGVNRGNNRALPQRDSYTDPASLTA